MNEKSGIFIFTRDRPKSLHSCFDGIRDTVHSVMLIDDSVLETNRIENQRILRSFNQSYLGPTEFLKFIREHKIGLSEYSFLLRQLGNNDWNLGYARNFALLAGKAAGFKRVLFMDDDIKVPAISVIDDLFALLAEYRFSGAHITGLVDDSILGHVATNSDIFNERMLSGGFMAFEPGRIEHYFLNNYNEDWIWLFLQTRDKSLIQTTEVMQALGDPLDDYTNKIMFQEFGEIALDGILDCYKQDDFKNLRTLSFWRRMLDERSVYLENLFQAAKHNRSYLAIIDYVRKRSGNSDPEKFKELFVKYFSNLRLFKTLFDSLE
jgi:hypothetical protein